MKPPQLQQVWLAGGQHLYADPWALGALARHAAGVRYLHPWRPRHAPHRAWEPAACAEAQSCPSQPF